jgi:hypothetical protein
MKAAVLSGLLATLLASTAVWAAPPTGNAADVTISVVNDPAKLGEKVSTISLPDTDGDESRPAAAAIIRKNADKVPSDTHAAYAAEKVTVTDLRAAVGALGFLENLPRGESLVIGVVYAANVPAAEASATETARLISAIPGPNSVTIRPAVISTADLGQFRGRLDALFLMPGASTQAETVLDAVHRRRVVSISSDPACLDEKLCVLMVRTGPRVEIVLDTALADAVGARFSPVFAMVVKRK